MTVLKFTEDVSFSGPRNSGQSGDQGFALQILV